MLNPHQISERLTVVAGLSLLAALIVPNAFAVEPMIEGGNELGFSPAGDPEAIVEAGGFDWNAVLSVVLIGLVVVTTLVVYHAAARRDRQLAAP